MKLIFSEFPSDYHHYHFPYAVMAQKEYADDEFKIFQAGFLPFRSKKDLYYLSRSTRIKLSLYHPSSENRRILSKVDYLTFTVQPLTQFDYTKTVQKFCADSAKQIGQGTHQKIPTSAIRKLLSGQSNANYIITYRSKLDQSVQGYVAIYAHANFVHYAHPFPSASSSDKNLNLGMMNIAIQWAKDQHKQFIYLGTCYTTGSLYKTQFSGFQYFNGRIWSDNLQELKSLVVRTPDDWLTNYPHTIPSDAELAVLTSELRVKQK